MSQSAPVSTTPLVPARPRRRRALLLAGLTFIAGLFLGSGLTIALGKHIIRNRMAHPEKIPEHILARVKRELNLSPDQVAKIAPLIKQHFEQILKLRQENQPKIQEQFDQLDQEVSPLLTDQQKPLWHRHLDKLRHLGPPPFGPPGPRPPLPPMPPPPPPPLPPKP